MRTPFPHVVRRRPAEAPTPVPAATWQDRLARLADAWGGGQDPAAVVRTRLAAGGSSHVWCALAVLSGRLPTRDDVVDARRAADLDGPDAVLDAARRLATPESAVRQVELLVGATVVDLGDLVLSPLRTGIQRVAVNVVRSWTATRDVTTVAWTSGTDAMRPVGTAERDRALADAPEQRGWTVPSDDRVVVPWRCTYLLPELAVQPRRCAALAALAEHGGGRTGVIGFDCVPLTSSETTATGFTAVFALNLAAVARFDAVACISDAAATEYAGWRRMLSGAGLPGPRITTCALPTHAPEPSAQDLQEAHARFVVAGLPLVVCVGSHEPRKNHVAVLQAAEMLWRRGLRFSLLFVGGNTWNGQDFERRLDELRAAGRPVESVSRLSDRLLWATYRIASFTVFPSLNEGFGLPVAESVDAGTPVVTSRYGSMREIAAGGGALLADPRDDDDIATQMARLLTDRELHASLAEQARGRSGSTWAAYSDALWEQLASTPAEDA